MKKKASVLLLSALAVLSAAVLGSFPFGCVTSGAPVATLTADKLY